MAEFQPVPIGRPPPRSWLPALGSALAIILALAIVKPWQALGPGEAAVQSAPSSAGPAAARTPEPRRERDTYDPRLFGNYEPEPAWELWPAGYVVEFGIAGPVDVHGQGSPAPSGGVAASDEPGSSPAAPLPSPAPTLAPASVAPTAQPGLSTPAPEHVVDIGASDHLIALGINTPADVRVTEIRLWKQSGAVCCDEPIPTVRLPTLWESQHFIVIGIEDPFQRGSTAPWLAGEYRLDLVTVGGEVRSVRLRVTEPVA